MTKRSGCCALIGLILAFLLGCGPRPVQLPEGPYETGCVRGTVYYLSPLDSRNVPFPGVTVTAWIHGTHQGLAEAITDESGNYCLNIPLGDHRVDLRVWGYLRLNQKDYTCNGSVAHLDLGSMHTKCGAADCLNTDIVAACKEFVGRRR